MSDLKSVKACMLRIWAGIEGRVEEEEGKVSHFENAETWIGLQQRLASNCIEGGTSGERG